MLRVGGELWMWYLGQGDDDHWHQRVCLATSRDGYHWEKPDLGLVKYGGSRHNNLVDMLGGEHSIVACVVYHDPDETDRGRRFKAVIETKDRPKLFGVLFSRDGLRWREFDIGPEAPQCEPSGGTKFNGCYLLSAHGGSHFGAPRQLVTTCRTTSSTGSRRRAWDCGATTFRRGLTASRSPVASRCTWARRCGTAAT